jgi:hypothetical protein
MDRSSGNPLSVKGYSGLPVVRGLTLGELIIAMAWFLSLRFAAQMPLAPEVRRIPVLLEELGDGWGFGAEEVRIARYGHDR